MSQFARTHLGARAARGFSLAEVLMATIIIALGTLGLLAVFAGAASQQQSASQNTKGAFALSNAESLITQNFGTLQATTGFTSLPPNDWYRLAMDEDDYHLLVVPPEVMGNDVYALKTVFNEELYAGTSLQDDSRVDCSGAPPDDQPNFSPASSSITFSQRRIEPKDTTLTVFIRYFDPDELRWSTTVPREFSRMDNGNVNEGVDLYLDPLDTNSSRISMNPAHSDGAGAPEFAEITQWDLDFTEMFGAGAIPSNACCRSLVITADYSWRSESLVSLNDRMTTRRDATSSELRFVPDLAMSVAFRRRESAPAQAVIFVYQLTPSSGAAEYIPPETEADISASSGGRSPLRLAEGLELGYDLVLEQYFFQGDLDEAWVLASGQVLLVVGDDAGSSTDPSMQGADAPVRVERVVRESGGLRAYIDRVPRFNNRSMLSATQRENETRVPLDVLAVNDSVESEADGSVWKLRALEAKVVDLPVNP